MTQSAQSPVTRLVFFMVCLSVAGAFVAGLHYYAVDLPQQNVVKAPQNEPSNEMKDKAARAYMECATFCRHPKLESRRDECDKMCLCYIDVMYGSSDEKIEYDIQGCKNRNLVHMWQFEDMIRGS